MRRECVRIECVCVVDVCSKKKFSHTHAMQYFYILKNSKICGVPLYRSYREEWHQNGEFCYDCHTITNNDTRGCISDRYNGHET